MGHCHGREGSKVCGCTSAPGELGGPQQMSFAYGTRWVRASCGLIILPELLHFEESE